MPCSNDWPGPVCTRGTCVSGTGTNVTAAVDPNGVDAYCQCDVGWDQNSDFVQVTGIGGGGDCSNNIAVMNGLMIVMIVLATAQIIVLIGRMRKFWVERFIKGKSNSAAARDDSALGLCDAFGTFLSRFRESFVESPLFRYVLGVLLWAVLTLIESFIRLLPPSNQPPQRVGREWLPTALFVLNDVVFWPAVAELQRLWYRILCTLTKIDGGGVGTFVAIPASPTDHTEQSPETAGVGPTFRTSDHFGPATHSLRALMCVAGTPPIDADALYSSFSSQLFTRSIFCALCGVPMILLPATNNDWSYMAWHQIWHCTAMIVIVYHMHQSLSTIEPMLLRAAVTSPAPGPLLEALSRLRFGRKLVVNNVAAPAIISDIVFAFWPYLRTKIQYPIWYDERLTSVRRY